MQAFTAHDRNKLQFHYGPLVSRTSSKGDASKRQHPSLRTAITQDMPCSRCYHQEGAVPSISMLTVLGVQSLQSCLWATRPALGRHIGRICDLTGLAPNVCVHYLLYISSAFSPR